jgi:hypothetical protein
VGGESDGFETGAADHVDGEGGNVVGEAATKGGLACRVLTEAGGKNVAHDALGDFRGIDRSAFNCSADGDGPELDGGEVRECTEELSDGGPGCTDDDNFAHDVSC